MVAGIISPTVIGEVDQRLRIYGTPSHHNKTEPLDELIFIVLSAQTEEYGYLQTYAELAQKYPNWNGLAEASESDIAVAILRGGLYRKKARQLRAAFDRLLKDFGTLTLTPLASMSDEDALAYLMSLPGVSRKTALCVMLYALMRQVFPVDTHTWRIARRLGWTPPVPKPSLKQTVDLEQLIPPTIRYSLHVNMVAHGRATCFTYDQRCGSCPLASICPSNGQPDLVWNSWRKPEGVWACNRPQ